MNTITFSPDMSLLYFIDNGRVIPFDLNTPNGVLVTILRGQLAVVSAPDLGEPEPPDGPDQITVQPGERPSAGSRPSSRSLAADPGEEWPPYPTRLSVDLPGNQITIFFRPSQRTLGIIGATDIDFALQSQTKPDTVISLFPIDNEILNIRRDGDRMRFVKVKI